MNNKDDYYKILGVKNNATDDEIKKAYKKEALKWHPDRHIGKTNIATEKFQKITEAYEVLSDPEKKQIYDYTRSEPEFVHRQSFTHTTPQEFNFFSSPFKQNNFNNSHTKHSFHFNSPFDMFGMFTQNSNIFKNAKFETDSDITISTNSTSTCSFSSNEDDCNFNKNKTDCKKKSKSKKGEIKHEVNVDLETLYTGGIKKFLISTEKDKKVFEINIKPGWKEGTKITFDDKDNPFGKVTFIIKEKSHNKFKRNGNDLIYRQRYLKKNKVLELTTLSGKDLNIDLTSEKRGSKITISNEGMPIRKNGLFNGYGDLIIELY